MTKIQLNSNSYVEVRGNSMFLRLNDGRVIGEAPLSLTLILALESGSTVGAIFAFSDAQHGAPVSRLAKYVK